MKFLVDKKIVTIHAFVIMNNHIHLIWNITHPYKRENIQRDFLKYTSRIMLGLLKEYYPQNLAEYFVNAKDRAYQIWERNALTIEIWTEDVLKQKVNYLHNNPIRAGLSALPENNKYSSASVYNGNVNCWKFVEPYFFSH